MPAHPERSLDSLYQRARLSLIQDMLKLVPQAGQSRFPTAPIRLTLTLPSGRYSLASYLVETDDCIVAIREFEAASD